MIDALVAGIIAGFAFGMVFGSWFMLEICYRLVEQHNLKFHSVKTINPCCTLTKDCPDPEAHK